MSWNSSRAALAVLAAGSVACGCTLTSRDIDPDVSSNATRESANVAATTSGDFPERRTNPAEDIQLHLLPSRRGPFAAAAH